MGSFVFLRVVFGDVVRVAFFVLLVGVGYLFRV